MKVVLLASLVLLCACEAKKSSGTFGKAVPKTSENTEVNAITSNATGATGQNKAGCHEVAVDFDRANVGATAVSANELAAGERASAKLKSSYTVLTDATGRVILGEYRTGNRYTQNCNNLGTRAAFELRYAAVDNFSLNDGQFGRLNGSGSTATRYVLRFDPSVQNGRPRAALIKDVRVRGNMTDLTTALVDLNGADARFFRLGDGTIEVRTRKTDGDLTVTFVARYEVEARN